MASGTGGAKENTCVGELVRVTFAMSTRVEDRSWITSPIASAPSQPGAAALAFVTRCWLVAAPADGNHTPSDRRKQLVVAVFRDHDVHVGDAWHAAWHCASLASVPIFVAPGTMLLFTPLIMRPHPISMGDHVERAAADRVPEHTPTIAAGVHPDQC